MRALLFVFAIFAIVLGIVDAREDRVARLKRQLLSRRGPFTGPTTITTTRTAETFAGTVLETCTIKLTPVNVNGQDLVQEEKSCKVELVQSSSLPPAATAPPAAPATPSATTTSTVVVTATAGAGQSSAPTSAAPSNTPVASAPPASTSPALGSQTSATPTSAPPSAPPTSSPSASAPPSSAPPTSTTPAGGPAKEIGTQTKSGSSLPPPSTTPSPSSSASAAPDQAPSSTSVSATPAQAEASPSTTQFTLPGKKLEVLPIGLGVFAGISVIALIVVGLVTYERTKYRKAFRQRKLAEQGAGMGYNGMSERV